MGNFEKLTPIKPCAEVVEAFGPVCLVNTHGAIENAFELVHGCYLFEYKNRGQAALVALSLKQFAQGNRVHINALQSTGEKPLQTRQIMAAIEHTAFQMGGDVLTLSTQHKAIAAGAARWGGHISGAVVTKYLGAM